MISNLKADEQHQHINGRGWVADTARVDDSVYVAEHALVYGHAMLSGRVRVLDLAQVSGHVRLSGDVTVCGHVWLDGNFKASTGVYARNERIAVKQERIR